jgi:murein DD-endopeptidase MepM/ murein hydrolase activator NlpD
VSTYYAHLDRQAVTPGQRVNAGDLVGWVGNTGNARTTPPHLHFGVYLAAAGAVDPLPFICDGQCGGRINPRVPAPSSRTKNGHAGTQRKEQSLHSPGLLGAE